MPRKSQQQLWSSEEEPEHVRANEIVGRAVEALPASARPKKYVARLAREVKELLAEGIDPRLIEEGALACVAKGSDPAVLSTFIVQAHQGALTPIEQEQLDDLLASTRLRWPTGTRFAHGTHGGRYVQDPLGVDQPPYSVPWGRPSRHEVKEALRLLRDHDERGDVP